MVSPDRRPGNQYVCRGVASWHDANATADEACATRVFMGTVDGRLIALDAETGKPCEGFGREGAKAGEVDAGADRLLVWPGEFQITSAPVVAGDVVIIGSSISDNRREDAPKGTVRAFDVRTGELRWSFDPVARGAQDDPDSWRGHPDKTGQANV